MPVGAEGIVVDSSLAAAWCFADEASPETDAVLRSIEDTRGLVPALWHFELTNMLVQAERRKRIGSADATALLGFLDSLPIETDSEAPALRRRDVWVLARRHKLTSYDAAYLELAIRAGLPLATRDQDLAGAAKECGVVVLPKP
jgi:predicted nucleic acid-binding protein